MNTYPDKSTYKTTVTAKLRNQIASFGNADKNYLEIGCDVGYTLLSVAHNFKRCCGIDIDHQRILLAQNRAAQNCDFITGTATSIPVNRWDVVLIDADHSYDSVKSDFECVVSKLTPGETMIIFHDYGLVSAGVKRFVSELQNSGTKFAFIGETSNWNPLGDKISGPEAAMMILQK